MEDDVIDLTDTFETPSPKSPKTNVTQSPNSKQSTLPSFLDKSPNNNHTKKNSISDQELEISKIDSELEQIDHQIQSLFQRREQLEQKKLQLLSSSSSDTLSNEEIQDLISSSVIANAPNDKKWTNNDFSWSKQLEQIANDFFNIKSFRPNQREIMNCTLSNKDAFVIMPTGGGKSLCYQLPAMYSKGITLVVSPLLSLIHDQVMAINTIFNNEVAVKLTGTSSKTETKMVYDDLSKANPIIKLLYVTPEKIVKSKRLMSKLEVAYKNSRLSRVVIDEAHCCSQWGHDFRRDYSQLRILKNQFPTVPIIALTATATNKVQDDVKEILQLQKCEMFVSSLHRANLIYEVRAKPSSGKGVIDDMYKWITENYPDKSGIVYCFSRKESEEVAKELKAKGIHVAFYHSDVPAEEKEHVHNSWLNDDIKIIVATTAFGMGIDKPDVRYVIHHTMPKSLENYYQESGRAGRDGLESHCILYYRAGDAAKQSSQVAGEHHGVQNLYKMISYCENLKECRKAMMIKHFGENLKAKCDQHCDNCMGRDLETVDITAYAKSLVEITQELERSDDKATLLQLVDVWRGTGKKTVSKGGKAPEEFKKADCERVIVHLLLEEVLREKAHYTAYAVTSYILAGKKANMVLRGLTKVSMDIEKPKAKKTPNKKRKKNENNEILSKINDLRKEVAKEHKCRPYTILTEDDMNQLLEKKPKTDKEIEAIIGVGKLKKIGDRSKEMLGWFASMLPFEKKKKKSPKKTKVVVEPEEDNKEEEEEQDFVLQDHGSDEHINFDDYEDFE